MEFEVRQDFGKSREAHEAMGKLDKILLGMEECYSKILKKDRTGSNAKLKNTILRMKSGELTIFYINVCHLL
ncbi:MAG: hypothetical protein KDC64_04850 [Aequorivita sp.]|nr:hypothetical protein [Aequorivita sp.]